jgi:hypothetical protein
MRKVINEQQKSFEEAARPLIKWLCENVHAHHSAIVTPTNAELLEGSFSTGQILDYVRDCGQNELVRSTTMTILRRGSEGFKQQNYPITANGCEAR